MSDILAQINEHVEARKKLVAEAHAMNDKVMTEKREMDGSEKAQWEKVMSEVDRHAQCMSKLRKLRDAEAEVKEEEDKAKEEEEKSKRDGGEKDEGEAVREEEDEKGERFVQIGEKRYALAPKTGVNRSKPGSSTSKLQRGIGETESEFRTRARRSSPEYRAAFWNYALTGNVDTRAIAADSDIVGGYLTAPQEFVGSLIKFVDNYLFVRKYATKYTVRAAQSLGAPSLDTDIADADWTAELDTGNEDVAMAFGKRELTPRPLAKRVKVSNRLLRMATINSGFAADGSVSGGGAEGLVRARLGYKFGVAEEKAFLLGNGANQPLGVFTASTRGIDTSRDVQMGSSTGFTADGLITAKYNQKVQYWSKMRWAFNRLGLALIRKLKDANGQYLWVPGGFGGEDDKLLGMPVDMSEYVPATFTTGQYVGILADWDFYWIADSEQLTIQRLTELYAAANQTGFIARMELDGMPVLAEAFTRCILN